MHVRWEVARPNSNTSHEKLNQRYIVAARTKNPTCSCAQWQLFSIELHRLLAPPPYANLSPNNEVDELVKYVHRGRILQYFCEYEDLQKNEHNLAEESKQNATRAES